MHRLIAENKHNAARIFPYLGGEEVNESPTHEHHRFVINFADFPLKRQELNGSWAGATDRERKEWVRTGIVPSDYPEPVAEDWPDLLAIVESKVKGTRASSPPRTGGILNGLAASWSRQFWDLNPCLLCRG